jgi:hypothetical protein
MPTGMLIYTSMAIMLNAETFDKDADSVEQTEQDLLPAGK